MSTNPTETIKDLKKQILDLQNKLRDSNQAFLSIVGKNRDGILIFDKNGIIVYANPAAVNLFGKNLGELLGENIGILVSKKNISEITIVNPVLGPIVVEINIASTSWNGEPATLASLRDVSEHKKTEKFLQHLSHFDYLTDLPNRVHFETTLRKTLSRAKRNKEKVALLYLDLDGFKGVNDTYGHQIGDKLLVQTAKLLKSSVRLEDTISRLGGDEFTIILESIKHPLSAESVAKKILSLKPIEIEKHTLPVVFSIGIAIFPDDSQNSDELIKHADSAMYTAKQNKTGYHVFSI